MPLRKDRAQTHHLMTTEAPQSLAEPTLKKRSAHGIHPGWGILVIAAAGMYMSGPGQSYSVAAFIDPMLADLSMLRTEYSTAYLVATLLGGLTLPWVGRQVDRYGARATLPLVALLLGFACCWMSTVRHVAALYIGFSMIRCLGQGSLTLISTWLIGEWFDRRRGMATGIVGLGGTISVMTVPQINNFLIEQYGWRNSWLMLGASVWVVLIIPGLLLIRNRPEEQGLLPDLKRPSDDSDDEEATSEAVNQNRHLPTTDSWTTGEACRTTTFWKLLAVVSTCSLVGTGLVFHQVSLLLGHGVTRSQALGLLGVQALVGTLSSLLGGYLTDRVQSRYLLLAAMVLLAAAIVLLMFLPSPGWSVLYAGLLGCQGGIIRSTGTVVWINYYGRLYQGAVRGVATSVMVIAAAFGPLPLAIAKDHFGDYRLALGMFLVLPVVAGIGVATAKQPVKGVAEG